jgi:hypothetical protein
LGNLIRGAVRSSWRRGILLAGLKRELVEDGEVADGEAKVRRFGFLVVGEDANREIGVPGGERKAGRK